jgi:hypothetical protein
MHEHASTLYCIHSSHPIRLGLHNAVKGVKRAIYCGNGVCLQIASYQVAFKKVSSVAASPRVLAWGPSVQTPSASFSAALARQRVRLRRSTSSTMSIASTARPTVRLTRPGGRGASLIFSHLAGHRVIRRSVNATCINRFDRHFVLWVLSGTNIIR